MSLPTLLPLEDTIPIPDFTDVKTVIIAVSAMFGLLFALVLGYVFSKTVLEASKRKAPMTLIIVLSLIAVVALSGYIALGNDRSELIAISSACVGALTATLTQTQTHTNRLEIETLKASIDQLRASAGMPPLKLPDNVSESLSSQLNFTADDLDIIDEDGDDDEAAGRVAPKRATT